MTEAIRQGDIPGVQLRRRRKLPIAPDELWSWLVDPAKLTRWAAERASVETGETGGCELAGPDGPEIGDTLEWSEPSLWVMAFRRRDWRTATRLEIEVEALATGSELSILQGGFEHLPLSDGLTLWESYRHRWSEALDRLEAVLADEASTD